MIYILIYLILNYLYLPQWRRHAKEVEEQKDDGTAGAL